MSVKDLHDRIKRSLELTEQYILDKRKKQCADYSRECTESVTRSYTKSGRLSEIYS